MSISAKAVKELRERTGVGMMACKKALEEANGDFEAAVKYLREKGLAKAASKGERAAHEGRIVTAGTATEAVMVEVNCETDFVGKNDSFAQFVDQAVQAALAQHIDSVEALEKATVEGHTLSQMASDQVLKLGENIKIGRMARVTGASVGHYTHMNYRVGVIIAFSGAVDPETAKDIAMHIAAANPQYISPQHVPAEELDKEKEVTRNQLRNEGRPENMLDKIVEGK
ncbi:MAG: translation elongation factor Ts, partial [Candidatus Margulisiibacteriota bacterium]